MEVKREPRALPPLRRLFAGFNPCFDGSEARVIDLLTGFTAYQGFNPCFDGSEARE